MLAREPRTGIQAGLPGETRERPSYFLPRTLRQQFVCSSSWPAAVFCLVERRFLSPSGRQFNNQRGSQVAMSPSSTTSRRWWKTFIFPDGSQKKQSFVLSRLFFIFYNTSIKNKLSFGGGALPFFKHLVCSTRVLTVCVSIFFQVVFGGLQRSSANSGFFFATHTSVKKTSGREVGAPLPGIAGAFVRLQADGGG